MNKTGIRILTYFIVGSIIISIIFLVLNFIGFASLVGDIGHMDKNAAKNILEYTDNNFDSISDAYFIEKDLWCILIDDNGDVTWQKNKPDDIAMSYSINDIAQMTRWFLNDYPVYVRISQKGLFVLGYPKNAVGKYFIEYSDNWFDTLIQRIIIVLLSNIGIAVIIAFFMSLGMYKAIKRFSIGIDNLSHEKKVNLKTKGIFSELSKKINQTSSILERRNLALKSRDNARSNWISGISHDIRTPLTVIIGCAYDLSNNTEGENKKKAEIITNQSVKIKNLINDLNQISSLEYDMQPSNKQEVRICTLLRKVVSDIINNGLSNKYSISLALKCERTLISCDETLLQRAIFNIINNSISHNDDGCEITISAIEKGALCIIHIRDNGRGINDEVLKNISIIPKTTHGIGLPMAYKICNVHGGNLICENDNGLSVTISLPKLY